MDDDVIAKTTAAGLSLPCVEFLACGNLGMFPRPKPPLDLTGMKD
ncbi:MAG: hypothetical protein ACFCD0_14705 [Gemmataceae bacterium]